MAYIAETLACHKVKDPVRFYLYTVAKGECGLAGREFSEAVTAKLQEAHRAYLATLSAFADSGGITYAKRKQSKEEKAHEQWHTHLIKNNLVSDAGDFIEEASAAVIESVLGGFTGECLDISRRFIELHKGVQKSSGSGLERLLEKHFVGRKEMIYEAGKQIMEGSCPWLSYISEAQYFLLYELCFGVYAKGGLRNAKKIYKAALLKAKRHGVDEGLKHLKQHATSSSAELYDFDLSDIGGYLPSCLEPNTREYVFFGGELKIDVCFAYKPWFEIAEKEIKRRGWQQD